jgi:hypothetical protein
MQVLYIYFWPQQQKIQQLQTFITHKQTPKMLAYCNNARFLQGTQIIQWVFLKTSVAVKRDYAFWIAWSWEEDRPTT